MPSVPWGDIHDTQEKDVLPAGTYDVMVLHAEHAVAKTGRDGLAMHLIVTSGPMTGEKFWYRIWSPVNPDTGEVSAFMGRKLRQFAKTLGITESDASEWSVFAACCYNKTAKVVTKPREGGDGRMYVEVEAWAPPPPAPPTDGQPLAPGGAVPPRPPALT